MPERINIADTAQSSIAPINIPAINPTLYGRDEARSIFDSFKHEDTTTYQQCLSAGRVSLRTAIGIEEYKGITAAANNYHEALIMLNGCITLSPVRPGNIPESDTYNDIDPFLLLDIATCVSKQAEYKQGITIDRRQDLRKMSGFMLKLAETRILNPLEHIPDEDKLLGTLTVADNLSKARDLVGAKEVAEKIEEFIDREQPSQSLVIEEIKHKDTDTPPLLIAQKLGFMAHIELIDSQLELAAAA